MRIRARVHNRENAHDVTLSTGGASRTLSVPPGDSGFGSSANGGELLFLALATCYCNDVYREAGELGISVEGVDVTVEGDFGAPGESARDVTYRARVRAHADEATIRALMERTDRLAEIHNTLRAVTPVALVEAEAVES